MKPEAPRKERSLFPAAKSPDPHPAPAESLGELPLPREPGPGAQARRAERRCSRPGRHDDRGASSLASCPLARGPRPRSTQAPTDPHPSAGCSSPSPAAVRGSRGADGPGPSPPAGPPPGAHPDLRPPLLRPRATASAPAAPPIRRCGPAQEAIADGHAWVVDLDLEAFFDRVNHDALMARVRPAG